MDQTKNNMDRIRACDAGWDENKHPRADNGQFTSGGGGGGLRPMAAGSKAVNRATEGKRLPHNAKVYRKKNMTENRQNHHSESAAGIRMINYIKAQRNLRRRPNSQKTAIGKKTNIQEMKEGSLRLVVKVEKGMDEIKKFDFRQKSMLML